MKDIANNMTKFMKKVMKEKEEEEVPEEIKKKEYNKPKAKSQIKKQKKINRRKAKLKRAPVPKSVDEQNKEMKERTPIIRDRSNKTRF